MGNHKDMNLPGQANIEILEPVKQSIASAALGLALNILKTKKHKYTRGD